MKKHTASLLTLLLAASGFLFSCGNIINKNTGALKFDSIRVNETAPLFGDTANPGCNLVISFAYATQTSDTKLKDSLNTIFLSACFGEKYTTMAPEEAVKKYTEKYIHDYRKDLEPMYRKDKQNKEYDSSMEEWYSYYKSLKSDVQLYMKNLLVYRIDYNEYTGGAHGIYKSTFLNMDLRTCRPVHLDDLFVMDYKEPLTDLLWNQLMADNKVATRQELEDLGYATIGDLEPIENFYLSKEGITFYYNVYEITPYLMGPVKITLPYESIQHLVSNDNEILKDFLNS